MFTVGVCVIITKCLGKSQSTCLQAAATSIHAVHGLQNHDHRASPQQQNTSVSSPRHSPRPRSPLHQGFAEVAQQHLAAVVGQILRAEGAEDPSVWQPIITRLALEAAYAVLPSALAAFGVSDPRFYIKVCKPFRSSLIMLIIFHWLPGCPVCSAICSIFLLASSI